MQSEFRACPLVYASFCRKQVLQGQQQLVGTLPLVTARNSRGQPSPILGWLCGNLVQMRLNLKEEDDLLQLRANSLRRLKRQAVAHQVALKHKVPH